MPRKVALITGAAHRIGEAVARTLHAAGYNIVAHHHHSESGARALVDEMNGIRPDSGMPICQDLARTNQLPDLIVKAMERWSRLDLLVNNASSFFPTVLGTVNESQWNGILDTNLKAPFFLCQAAYPHLKNVRGCIVNLTDIHADRGLNDYSVYCISKAALNALTRFLAKEFAPEVRVNGVAPGAILWPEGEQDLDRQQRIIRQIPLGEIGKGLDVATAVLYLASQASYVTGQVLAVDGGRSLVS